MATVSWPGGTGPTDLPDNPFQGYTEEMISNVIGTDMASGPPKLRRRSTRIRRIQSTPIQLTQPQYETFCLFWENIKHGADPFSWNNMMTGTAANFQFVPGRHPKWKNDTPGPVASRYFSATIVIELLTPTPLPGP